MASTINADHTWLGSTYVVQLLSEKFGLRILPANIDMIVLSAIFFHIYYNYVIAFLSKLLMKKQWEAFSEEEKTNWRLRINNITESLIVGPYEMYIVLAHTHRNERGVIERMYSYDETEAIFANISTGFFVWHFVHMLMDYKAAGLEFILHGLAGSGCLLGVYRPLILHYTPNFLIYEVTNIPQNIYRILSALGHGTSLPSVINALVWIVLFFYLRIIQGTWETWRIMQDLWTVSHGELTLERLGPSEWKAVEGLRLRGLAPEPVSMLIVVYWYILGSILVILNFLWFYLIVRTTVRKVSKLQDKSS